MRFGPRLRSEESFCPSRCLTGNNETGYTVPVFASVQLCDCGEREREARAHRRNAMAPCDHNTSSSGGDGGPFKRRGLVFIFGYLAV